MNALSVGYSVEIIFILFRLAAFIFYFLIGCEKLYILLLCFFSNNKLDFTKKRHIVLISMCQLILLILRKLNLIFAELIVFKEVSNLDFFMTILLSDMSQDKQNYTHHLI